jgi:hypothetical protein
MVVAADTAAGLHTLGEEYCDIVQLKTSTNFFPTFMVPSLSRTLFNCNSLPSGSIFTGGLSRTRAVLVGALLSEVWQSRFCYARSRSSLLSSS